MAKKKKTNKKINSSKSDIASTTRVVICSLLGVILAAIAIYLNHIYEKHTEKCDPCLSSLVELPPTEALDDPMSLHIEMALAAGLERPVETVDAAAAVLEKVVSNSTYDLQLSSCSMPYLEKEALRQLQSIGIEFKKEAGRANIKNVKFNVVNLTMYSRCEPRGDNPLLYGTTFEISGFTTKKEVPQATLQNLLENVLSAKRSRCEIVCTYDSTATAYLITVVYRK